MKPKPSYSPRGYTLYISPKDLQDNKGDIEESNYTEALLFYINPLAFTGFVALKWSKMIGIGLLKAKGVWRRLHSLGHLINIKVHERTAELELINKQLESFGFSVSHDLKAPLRVISGYCDILIKSPEMSKEEHLEIIQMMQSSSQKMGQLIDTLMHFSKTGAMSILKQRTDMNLIVENILDGYAKSNARVISHYMSDAWCDPKLIEQVWVNLISNAIKYSAKADQPVIEVGATLIRGLPVYYVRDNGTGFDMKFAGKLFRPFQRLHSESDFEGSGIGLALCHNIILKHGGRIWAKSAAGQGSTFNFTLQ